MTEIKLTGPHNCAECDTELAPATVEPGDITDLAFTIEGVRIPVPGLYVCTPCAGAIMVGERESRVTLGDAAEFLAGNFIPAVLGWMAVHDGDERAHDRFHEAVRVGEILALASLMEMMEEAAEAEGVDPEDMAVMVVMEDEPHPRQMATFN